MTLIRPPVPPPPDIPAAVRDGIESLARSVEGLTAQAEQLKLAAGLADPSETTRLDIFHGYMPVLLIAFLVTLLVTPLMRRLAITHGVVDRPDESRKLHRVPVAYLGGVAVFLGIMAGILYSYFGTLTTGLMSFRLMYFHPSQYLGADAGESFNELVPGWVLLGMFVIMLVGLLDDVVRIQPHLKVGGQLFAAAALAVGDIGVRVANGLLAPLGRLLGNEGLVYTIQLPGDFPLVGTYIPIDIVYWTGTAIIAVFVLGACNASNLIDGLDGLCSGVHAIAAAGLLVVALTLAMVDDGPRDAQRIVLCLALLGACLGFLPHNFNPASIFLGDCGSMILGYTTIVIVLTLGGENGFTHMVLAGLVIYAIPIVDTVLAIIRRRLEGKDLSAADDQHLHHMLKRALGVKGAVFTLYGIGVGCAALGVMMSLWRARVIYALAIIFLSFLIVVAIKAARRRQIEAQAAQTAARRAIRRAPPPEEVGAGAGSSFIPRDHDAR